MVGSVIVHNNTIIGEGWHKVAGEAHAEVNAIRAVKNPQLLKEATIYVSLEPCSHFGKTPPCSDLIIEKGIPNVVIGTVDPFAEVSGRGIQKLMQAGCTVTVGVLENECQELNKRFFTYHNQKRPYILLKWAETKDGFIAPEHKDKQEPFWISNAFSKQFVHKMRSEEQAILVGTKTVLDDNPSLTTREWRGKNPVRIIIDKDLKINTQHAIHNTEAKTIILTSKEVKSNDNIIYETVNFKNLPEEVCQIAYKHQLQSIIIEGGKHTLENFIDQHLWDETYIFTGNLYLHNGLQAPKLHSKTLSKTIVLGNDELKIFKKL